MLNDLRQTMMTGLDELEYVLEAGNRDQVESILKQMRKTITADDFEPGSWACLYRT